MSKPTNQVPKGRRKPAVRAKAVKKRENATRTGSAGQIQPLDLSAFPPESVITVEKWLCLACVSDVFTRHLNLSPLTAYLEIKRYTPLITELYAPADTRPWFCNRPLQKACPCCVALAKWHARLWVYRVESSKATGALRRDLIKSLTKVCHYGGEGYTATGVFRVVGEDRQGS